MLLTRLNLTMLAGLAMASAAVATPGLVHAREVVTFAASSFAEPGRGDKMRAWLDEFNKSQDKVEVKAIAIPFSSFVSTVFTQMGGGSGPDLVRFDLPEFYAAAEAGRLAPLDSQIKDKDFNFGSADKYMRINGKRYGVVFEVSNYAMIYNKALLKGAPPKNFDEFLAAAKAATSNGNYGFAYRATMAERGGMWYDLSNFVYGFGGRWSNDQGKPTLNSPEVVRGIQAYKQVYDANILPKGADAATYRRMFAQGKLAMEIDNGGVAANLATEGKNIQTSATPSPFPHREQAMILAPITVNANSKHQDAATVFLKWMLGAGPQAQLQQIHGASSVAIAVPRTPEEEKKWPWINVYDEQTQHSVPPLPKGLETKAPEIQQIVVQQVIRVLQNGTDPQQAMDEAQQKAERVASKK